MRTMSSAPKGASITMPLPVHRAAMAAALWPMRHGVCAVAIRRITVPRVHKGLILHRPIIGGGGGAQCVLDRRVGIGVYVNRVEIDDVDVAVWPRRGSCMQMIPDRRANETCGDPRVGQVERGHGAERIANVALPRDEGDDVVKRSHHRRSGGDQLRKGGWATPHKVSSISRRIKGISHIGAMKRSRKAPIMADWL